jgi:hypothetical protein
MKKGEIFFDKNFAFTDSTIGEKLFILLTEKEPYLVLKTTSNSKQYPNVKPYCNPPRLVFYIPVELKQSFTKNTYIQLNEIFEYNNLDFLKKSFNKEIKSKGTLTNDILNSLFNCLDKIKDDISPKHYKLLFSKNHPQPKKTSKLSYSE